MLLRTDAPSWLYQVEHGATTIWERWDAIRPDGSIHPGHPEPGAGVARGHAGRPHALVQPLRLRRGHRLGLPARGGARARRRGAGLPPDAVRPGARRGHLVGAGERRDGLRGRGDGLEDRGRRHVRGDDRASERDARRRHAAGDRGIRGDPRQRARPECRGPRRRARRAPDHGDASRTCCGPVGPSDDRRRYWPTGRSRPPGLAGRRRSRRVVEFGVPDPDARRDRAAGRRDPPSRRPSRPCHPDAEPIPPDRGARQPRPAPRRCRRLRRRRPVRARNGSVRRQLRALGARGGRRL